MFFLYEIPNWFCHFLKCESYTSCTSNTGCANILHHMFVKLCSMFVYHNNMANIVNKP